MATQPLPHHSLFALPPRMRGGEDAEVREKVREAQDAGAELAEASPKVKEKRKQPSLYRVLLLNDDYTPMEFVVSLLEQVFHKNVEEATRIMLHVHHNGVGLCGVYTYEVAETKMVQAMSLARRAQHPLQCALEKA